MMMLVHDVGCGVKSLTRPLTFLLINLGTASEISYLIYRPYLCHVTHGSLWNILYQVTYCGAVLRTCVFNLAD